MGGRRADFFWLRILTTHCFLSYLIFSFVTALANEPIQFTQPYSSILFIMLRKQISFASRGVLALVKHKIQHFEKTIAWGAGPKSILLTIATTRLVSYRATNRSVTKCFDCALVNTWTILLVQYVLKHNNVYKIPEHGCVDLIGSFARAVTKLKCKYDKKQCV